MIPKKLMIGEIAQKMEKVFATKTFEVVCICAFAFCQSPTGAFIISVYCRKYGNENRGMPSNSSF